MLRTVLHRSVMRYGRKQVASLTRVGEHTCALVRIPVLLLRYQCTRRSHGSGGSCALHGAYIA